MIDQPRLCCFKCSYTKKIVSAVRTASNYSTSVVSDCLQRVIMGCFLLFFMVVSVNVFIVISVNVAVLKEKTLVEKSITDFFLV